MEIFNCKRNRHINEIIKLYIILNHTNLFTKKIIIYIIRKTKEKGDKKLEYKKFIPTNWNEELKEGQIVEGTVKNIRNYGAFIEIEKGPVGLVYIEDMSISRIKTPYERLKIGQKSNFMVKSIDRENKKVFLSYKELLGSWEENAEKFQEGVVVSGIARETEKSKNGIFVELTPNLVGLAEYKDGIEYGQNVNVYIKKIIPDKKKVKLIIV